MISVNSWTSGLICAVGALGLSPGDEVIVPTWTMSATAAAILHWNCIPIFADIDPKTFNICPLSVESLVSSRTKAIVSVDIFGQCCDMSSLRRIADQYNLFLLSDTAQSPGSKSFDAFTGCHADIGGFSLNYHKHIHCGEGGLIVTNDDSLASRMRLIRNHGEAVIESSLPGDLSNIIGYNFRLGEIEAAIARQQFSQLNFYIDSRIHVANQLTKGLSELPGLKLPFVSEFTSHVYYVYGMLIDTNLLPFDREWIVSALRAEGVQSLYPGYTCVHRYPLYQQKVAFGPSGFPWTLTPESRDLEYSYHGLCPVAEDYHDNKFLGLGLCNFQYTTEEVNLLIGAFHKVWNFMEQNH